MGNTQSNNESGLDKLESDEDLVYQNDSLSVPTEQDTKEALLQSKHMPGIDVNFSDQRPYSNPNDTLSSCHDYSNTDPLVTDVQPGTNTKCLVSDCLSSQIEAALTIEDICLEEADYLINTDGFPLTENCRPIVVEPGDDDNDETLSSSQDSDRLPYQLPRNSVQVTDLIDELIQKALLDGKKVDEKEALTATEPPKKKKSNSKKKTKTNVSRSAKGSKSSDVKLGRGDAGVVVVKTSAEVVGEHVSKTKPDSMPVAWEVDCTDFAAPKTKPKKSTTAVGPKKYRSKASKWMIANEGAEDYLPPEVKATVDEMTQKKMLDHRRWLCISRPQYSKSCGLSSLVGCWNYLFSTLGAGNHQPITQEQALTVLGFKPPFTDIRFGPFTGNATLMRWFQQLNNHYGVRGRAYFLYKPHGKNRTMGRTSEEGVQMLKKGLQDETMTFIYHCWNHYFCPIGYEDVPLKAVDAYRGGLTQDEVETWILIGDSSRKHPGMHCFKWSDISTDLNCQMPEYLNIRKLHLGVQKRKTKKVGGNLHCIMVFQKSQWQGLKTTRASKKGVKCGKETSQSRGKKGGKKVKSSTQGMDDKQMGVNFGKYAQCVIESKSSMEDVNSNVEQYQGQIMGNDCVESTCTSRGEGNREPSGGDLGVRLANDCQIISVESSEEEEGEEGESESGNED